MSASSSVNHRVDGMEFFYIMNNLTLLSSIKENTTLYTSKDRNSIKIASKRIFLRRRGINQTIFRRTFTEAFKILETSRTDEKSKQITKVLEKAINGLDVVSKSLEKKNKSLCRDFYGMYFEFRRKYQNIPPPPPPAGISLSQKISMLSQRALR